MLQALKTFLISIIFWGWVSFANAQIVGQVPSPYASVKQNSISNIAALGDTLWIGPALNRTINNNADWFYPKGATKITEDKGRVFSLALAPDTIWAGLGYEAQGSGGGVQAGLGFHFSTDGGDTWSYVENPREAKDDTILIYGGKIYANLPITIQEQAPPFDLAMNGSTILSAGWALGIVRSQDFGSHWERLILPPQSADSLVPEKSYNFNGDGKNRYDPRYDQNLLGFAVAIDNQKRVWAGTAGGLNISDNALTAPRDSIRWQHLQFDGSPQGLLSNWIITIRQQPSTGDIWLTNWVSGLNGNEQYGIVRTSDAGKTFDHYLIGERINDVGFRDEVIYAAGDDGLFISNNNGDNWSKIPQIESADSFIKKSAQYYSVAATTKRLWVGTSDGLASTADNGHTWQITRVNFPLGGRNRYQQEAPKVEAYAYPNPFSPRRHGLVRIKYQVNKPGNVRIRLFDFGINLIKQLDSGNYTAGTYEAVWDGTDDHGQQVSNGPIFYQIDTPENTIRGKILVID